MKKSGQQLKLEELERHYVEKVQNDTKRKMMPFYTTYLLVSAVCFAYFILTE